MKAFISVCSMAVMMMMMMMMMSSVDAQNPKPCVAPALLSGGFTLISDGSMSTGSIDYDAIGKRLKINTHFSMSGNSTGQELLMLFHQKVLFEINWRKFSCKKKPLDASFIPMHVPEDAQLMGQVFMGSSSSFGMGVLVNNWFGSLPQNGTYNTVFTEIGCIPMTYQAYTPSYGMTFLSTFNWVIGNADPMRYHVPFFCGKAQLEETPETPETPETFFTALKSLETMDQI